MHFILKAKFHIQNWLKHAKFIYIKLKHLTLFMLAGTLILACCFSTTNPTLAKSCDDVKFIFARGSGELLNGPSAAAWRSDIESTLRKSTLQYGFYELGTITQGSYRYPAASVSDSFAGFGNLLGAYLSRGEFFNFGNSVKEGIGELRAYLRTTSSACPKTKYVLGGYSQGAMVLSRSLDQLDSERIIYVATFGDPKLYLPEGKGMIPPACLGKSHSDYRVYVPDCRAYEGVLGSYRPYQPAGYKNKLGVWCNQKDIMCSSGASIEDHTSYTSEGLYYNAAREIKTHLKREFPDAFTSGSSKPWASVAHNIAFVFDTTVSMVNYLKAHSQAADELSKQVTSEGGSAAIVEFRDLDDPYNPQILCGFSCSQSEISAKLKQLPIGDGGDNEESALSALLYAMNHLDWQVGATKSIVLVTDDEYLSPDRDGTILSDVVQRSLEIDPVNVYVLTRQQFHDSYNDLTSQTNGALYNINDLNEWSNLSDDLLYRPRAELNATEFSGMVGDTFHFDAGQSAASDGGNLRYDWDLDGDGKFEVLNGPAQITHSYHQPFSGYIQVKATDNARRFSTMSAKLTILSSPPIMPEVYDADYEELYEGTYRIRYHTNAERILVAIDDSLVGYYDGTTQNFTIDNIAAETKLQLIPYSSKIGRGTGAELVFGRNANFNPQPTTPPQSDHVDDPKVPTESDNTPPMSPALNKIVPKAPNTGVARFAFTFASY